MQTVHPIKTVPTAPSAPSPQWQGIFVEPMYADGQPYQELDTEVDDAPTIDAA